MSLLPVYVVILIFCAAIAITGHDRPIIVGLTRIINCSTILEANTLEWILVGLDDGDPVEERSDGGMFLELVLTPEATELNGAQFICRVTTMTGNVFEETVAVEIKG